MCVYNYIYINKDKASCFILLLLYSHSLLYYSFSFFSLVIPPVPIPTVVVILHQKRKHKSRAMVFPSIPPYLDPSNWQQQQTHQQPIRNSASSGFPPPPGGGAAGSIRPGSMAERARMANIPLPEPALKCPRCDSTNTKFCYFNNYSLSQPRHFCKACRRYWTRGGALRSVPVGGGCRRNKRSKSSSSSKSSSAQTTTTTTTTAPITTNTNSYMNMNMNSMLGLPPRFISPLTQFSESLNFSGDHHMGLSGYNQITASPEMNFNPGFLDGSIEPWKLQQQQFPFVEQFHGESSFMGGIQRPKFSSSMLSGSIKMEERQLLGGLMPAGNEQWSNNNNNNDGSNAGNWTELGNFSSSSTSNPL